MLMESLHESVLKSDPEKTRQVAQTVLDDGISPMAAISSLTAVMVEVGDKFSRLEIFLPEMMQAGENMSAAVEVLSKEIEDFESIAKKGKIVLGTVKGDLHEIGKNIVKLMLETNGFEVKDLGYDVDSAVFIKEAEAMGADVIAMSSLMTTTMPLQKEVINMLKDKNIRDKYKIIIGGAPTTRQWADEIGADLYCTDAGSAPKQIAELIGS